MLYFGQWGGGGGGGRFSFAYNVWADFKKLFRFRRSGIGLSTWRYIECLLSVVNLENCMRILLSLLSSRDCSPVSVSIADIGVDLRLPVINLRF